MLFFESRLPSKMLDQPGSEGSDLWQKASISVVVVEGTYFLVMS
jgi:hypothetical protein